MSELGLHQVTGAESTGLETVEQGTCHCRETTISAVETGRGERWDGGADLAALPSCPGSAQLAGFV